MRTHKGMRPQDIGILLKIVALESSAWNHVTLAQDLFLSQSEISESLNRSAFARLIDPAKKKVYASGLLEFLQYGLRYTFPVQPGSMVRGIPTAHSAKPLSELIISSEVYVWPDEEGHIRGQAITPLYGQASRAAKKDSKFYALLALVDALRVGRIREQALAMQELTNRIKMTNA